MPEPQQAVDVTGPDGKHYKFPPGTTKDKAIGYFRRKGIGGAPKTPSAPVTPLTAPKTKGSGFLTEPGGTGRKIETGVEQGVVGSLGLKFPDPNRPSSLTWKSIAGQLISQLGSAAAQSLKEWGPGAPADMIAKGIEGMASGIESGTKKVYEGAKEKNLQKASEGVGQLGGTAAQIVEGAEIAKKIPSMPDVPLDKVFSMAKMQNFMDKYVHAAGLDLKETYKKAVKGVNDNIDLHASALNKAIPKDTIDGSDVLKKADQAIADVVKTPAKYPPELQQIAQSIKAHPPGKWDFETAKQFRTNINAAMKRSSGPMKAALTESYADITAKMESAAKAIKGGETSWNYYNELTRKFHQQFGDHVEDITGADSGHKVSGAILKDPSLAREAAKSLAKYGLDMDKFSKFVKHSQDVVKAKKFLGNSMFRYIYGTAAGGGTMVAGRMAGLGWVGSIGPAVVAGLTSIYLKNLRTLLELDPSIIDKVEKARELPGPQKVTIQAPPAGATPQASPTGTPPASPAGAGGTPKIKPLTAAEKLALRQQRASTAGTAAGPGAQASTTGTPSAPSPTVMQVERTAALEQAGKELVSNLAEIKQVESEAKKPPEVKKIPEGVHGNPQEALREKWRERKAATRQQAVRTETKGAEEASIGGGPASRAEFSKLPSVDIEKDLAGDSPEGKALVSAIKKMKIKEGWDDDEYRGHLVEMAEGYAKRMAKRRAQ